MDYLGGCMRPLLLALALLALAAPAAALADAFDDVFEDYQRDARIDPCRHSEKTLQDARRQVPNDIEQYAPDFPDALEDALERRARGDCEEDDQAATTPTTPSGSPGDAATTPGGAAPPA